MTDEKEYPPEVEKILATTRRKLDEIIDDEQRIIKKMLWSLYDDYGIPPRTMRKAFNAARLNAN